MSATPEIDLLLNAFDVAVGAVAPELLVPRAIDRIESHGPAIVLGAGKGAASMAAAFHAAWRAPVRGFVVTPYGHGLRQGETAGAIEIVEAAHPSPDEASVAAGQRLLEIAAGHSSEEQLFFLVSGGGSALAAVPLPGLQFSDKRDVANHLMHSGASISEINCVRKHLSALKGGRLAAAAHPARVTTWAISDVPGDHIADIASGPTIADPTTQADAIRILERYSYGRLSELMHVLGDPDYESPKPGDGQFANDDAALIGKASDAFAAATDFLQGRGYEVLMLGDHLDEDAQTLGREHAALAIEQLSGGGRVAILSGGETRVTVRRHGGRGGRNLVYLSRLALTLGGHPGIFALAADTDGIDGRGGHAGGVAVPSMFVTAEKHGVNLESLLAGDDSYTFYDVCDLLVRTGPTRTNVNDFRLILCHP